MNKTFAIGLQSLLLVGALLPFSPLMSVEPSQSHYSVFHSTTAVTASDSELVAFGRGVPRFRGGGGTR